MRPSFLFAFAFSPLLLAACGKAQPAATTPANAVPSNASGCGGVGFVDIDAIIMRTVEGPTIDKENKAEFEKRQKELSADEEKLKKEQAAMEAASKSLSQAAIQQMAAAYQQDLAALQQKYVENQKALDADAQKRADAARARVRAFITAHGDLLGHPEVNVIVEGRALWVKPTCPSVNVDLTDAVVTNYRRDSM